MAIFTHAAKVQLDGFLDASQRVVNRFPRGNATGQIRNRRSPIAIRIFLHANQVPVMLGRHIPGSILTCLAAQHINAYSGLCHGSF